MENLVSFIFSFGYTKVCIKDNIAYILNIYIYNIKYIYNI